VARNLNFEMMMTNGPDARIGRVLAVDIPRPRTRRVPFDLLSSLDEFEHGAAARPVARSAA
jgi:nitrate/nitrite transport system ATP-binding protein